MKYEIQDILEDLPSVTPTQEPGTEKIIEMRDATPEERESTAKYIKSISKHTGVDFCDLEQEPCEDCIARQPLIDNWNCCADMLMGEGDAEVVMGWIFDAPSVRPTQELILNKIREELKVMTSNRGFLSCSVGHIHKEIDNVFDKYKTAKE